MCKKINLIVLFSLILSVLGSSRVLAEERRQDMTIVTTVDFRYNNQAPVGYFEVSGVDGKNHVAFCGWHEKKLPEKGWEMTTLEVYTAANKKNENLRKVLWYGFDGPGNIGANYSQTALAASVALGHMDTDDTGETEGPIGKTFLAQVKGMETPPEEFQVYCVRNLEETEYKYQCLVYYIYNPNGAVKVLKKSTNEEVVKDNSCYSLENAVYGVFSDEKCINKVGELVTDKEGNTEELEVKAGIYYLKELKAPKGYKLDDTVKSVNVTEKETIAVSFENEPYVFRVEDIISKYDRELGNMGEKNVSQGAAILAGAEYKIEFYAEEFMNVEDIGNKEPKQSWVLETDADGKIQFNETLPLGTLVVKETKAPKGYLVNSEIYVKNFNTDRIMQDGNFMQAIEWAEDVIKGNVKITKFYLKDERKVPMEGIVFVLRSKTNGKEYRITTDSLGEASTIEIGGLPYDIYEITEENTPAGFIPCDSLEVAIDENEEVEVFEIENKQIEIEEPEVPKKDIVKTGDMSQRTMYIVLLILSIGMLVAARKLKK